MSEPIFNGPLAHLLREAFEQSRPDPWSPQDDAAVKAPDAVPLCVSCLCPQDGHYWFCPNCGFPTGQYAAVMPYVNVFLNGEIFRRGVMGPPERRKSVQFFIFVYATCSYHVFAPIYWYWMYRRSVGKPICAVYRKEFRVDNSVGDVESFDVGKNMNLSWRYASDADISLLADWNHQLIRDEGHRNPVTVEQLADRMRKWLQGEYQVVVFSDSDPVGYALFKKEESLIYLRQFFVRRDRRRAGIGRLAFEKLRREIWPSGIRLTVDVLCQNTAGVAFWRSLGYRDYCLTLEIMPQ